MAYNDYGFDQQHIYLTTDPNFASPPDPNPQKSLQECCRLGNASNICKQSCQHLDHESFLRKALQTGCYQDIYTVIGCSNDNVDRSECCRANEVPTTCQPLCWGGSIGKTSEPFCGAYLSSVMFCLNHGKSFVPDPPTNISHGILNNGSVLLLWLPPANHEEDVSQYLISARIRNKGLTKLWKVDGDSHSYLIKDITEGEEYTFTVRSYNAYGTSYPVGIPYTVYLKEPVIKEQLKLNATLVDNSFILITWIKPSHTNYDGVYLYYTVKNSLLKQWKPWTMIFLNQSVNEYRLTSLIPESNYIITLAIRSTSGHLGPRCQPIKLFVANKEFDFRILASVVFIAIIIITILAFLILFCIRRKIHFFKSQKYGT